jgi:hypothetical protein
MGHTYPESFVFYLKFKFNYLVFLIAKSWSSNSEQNSHVSKRHIVSQKDLRRWVYLMVHSEAVWHHQLIFCRVLKAWMLDAGLGSVCPDFCCLCLQIFRHKCLPIWIWAAHGRSFIPVQVLGFLTDVGTRGGRFWGVSESQVQICPSLWFMLLTDCTSRCNVVLCSVNNWNLTLKFPLIPSCLTVNCPGIYSCWWCLNSASSVRIHQKCPDAKRLLALSEAGQPWVTLFLCFLCGCASLTSSSWVRGCVWFAFSLVFWRTDNDVLRDCKQCKPFL